MPVQTAALTRLLTKFQLAIGFGASLLQEAQKHGLNLWAASLLVTTSSLNLLSFLIGLYMTAHT